MMNLKVTGWILGLICTFSLIVMVLITSIEFVIYDSEGYFEKQYKKYNVADVVKMEMDDLLTVTDEMMGYLKGKQDDLTIMTKIAGEEREFFNEKEKAHMVDVKKLFLGAIHIRRIAAVAVLFSIMALILMKYDYKRILFRSFQIGSGIFFILAAVISLIVSTDFTKYFTVFHEIFFTNDLWMLDPNVDLLVNIVPEPFFIDTAIYICSLFTTIIIILLVTSTILLKRNRT